MEIYKAVTVTQTVTAFLQVVRGTGLLTPPKRRQFVAMLTKRYLFMKINLLLRKEYLVKMLNVR